jgi:integrase
MRFESSKSTKYADAEALLTTRRKGVQEGRDDAPKRIKPCTLGELSVKYLECAKRQKSYRGKKNVVERLVKDFGNLPLSRFNTLIIDEYQSRLLSEGNQSMTTPTGGKKPSTVNRYVTTLRNMVRKGYEWEMCGEETLKRVRAAKNLTENNRRTRKLTVDEGDALINQCSGHLRPIIITLLHTMQRKEEVLSLEWDRNVFLKQGFIQLDATQTKNGEPRRIPITQTLRETLQGLVRRVDVPFVFYHAKGKNSGERFDYIDTGFKAACRRAGITNLTIHDLRRTGASYLHKKKVPLVVISEILGHHDVRTTMRYLSIDDQDKIDAMTVLDGVFDGGGTRNDSNLTVTLQSPSESLLEAPSAIASS